MPNENIFFSKSFSPFHLFDLFDPMRVVEKAESGGRRRSDGWRRRSDGWRRDEGHRCRRRRRDEGHRCRQRRRDGWLLGWQGRDRHGRGRYGSHQ
tara:strand:- start:395 stop:679 length:285 start_codon:yes stop_codon:yes gene_type:complete